MKFQKIREQHVKIMHEMVTQLCNDEKLVMLWLSYGCPDNPQEDDFEFIASDPDNYIDTINLFNSIMANEISDGEFETTMIKWEV